MPKDAESGSRMAGMPLDALISDFAAITGIKPRFDPDYTRALTRLGTQLAATELYPSQERRRRFLAQINCKFRLNADRLATFYATAAKRGYTFNYHQKAQLQSAFDHRGAEMLRTVLVERIVPEDVGRELVSAFLPIEEQATVDHLRSECLSPTKLRREKGDRDVEVDILQSLFSSLLWSSVPTKELYRHFDPDFSEDTYRESFWEQLHLRSPHLFSRQHALHIIRFGPDSLSGIQSITAIRDAVCKCVDEAYDALNNYGFLAVILCPIERCGRHITWEIAADITLFAEKHLQGQLENSYFRWRQVEKETVDYLRIANPSESRFDLVNEGFTYRDCFVMKGPSDEVSRLLLLFQKNARDETLIPCPACRTRDVRGNSYPSLGVRSWECNNPLCPERSKYNRGKRYSFRALAMQQAIDDERNLIPADSVRRWQRDVVDEVSDADLFDMLLRHYSIHGDSIHLTGWERPVKSALGRTICYHPWEPIAPESDASSFWQSPIFLRYTVDTRDRNGRSPRNLGTDEFVILPGDATHILPGFDADYFDGAVTSPPYYNAREYSQWPNIYCYLGDMMAVNREVFRTLKPGALYFYNIFDYFDNERTVVFSAMGQKRMILSAYTVDLFRRIGFECVGNIVWDKGDIEGKRGFNAGNFSPYYQSPFNCWEHILVFRKPGGSSLSERELSSINRVLRQQPVLKFVRGENTHGHSAPFPDAIPEIALEWLPPNGRILDPFAGSLTTGRVAIRRRFKAVCIERLEEYCRLGLRFFEKERSAPKQQSLFDSE